MFGSDPARLFAVLLVVATLASPALLARELTAPLSDERVACDAARLRGLMGLNQAGLSSSLDPAWTFFASPSQADSVGLLMITNQFRIPPEGEPVDPFRVPEYHLAATLTSTMRPIILNPERPRLDQMALVRDDTNSTVGNPNAPAGLRIVLSPSFHIDDEANLIVDLREEEGANKPGRALTEAGLDQACHDLFTDEDRLVFSVLQRTFRPRYESLFPFDDEGPGQSEIAICRGAEPDVYLIDCYDASYFIPFIVFDPVSFRLTLTRDAEGRLATGQLDLMTQADPNLPFRDLFFIPPTFPGFEMWSEDDPRVTHAYYPNDFIAGPQVTVDFAAQLDKSTWNPPRY